MRISRRGFVLAGLGSVVVTLVPGATLAAKLEELAAAFIGDGEVSDEGVTLSAPEIAENGNSVSVEVEAPGAVAIMLLASGNPEPAVATFNFGPAAASQRAVTRIRLALTQDVVALARMADGSIRRTDATVKVTIGGCGG